MNQRFTPAGADFQTLGPMKPVIGKRYRLRSGDVVSVSGTRDALMLDGKTLEPIWYGKFTDGGMCAWNVDGSYRASSGKIAHRLDIVAEAR